jgi:hypothetical protein
MMNIAARFSLSKKPRFVDQERKKPIRLKVILASLVTLQQGRRFTIKRVSVSSTSSNVEPAHNTTKYFAPNLR